VYIHNISDNMFLACMNWLNNTYITDSQICKFGHINEAGRMRVNIYDTYISEVIHVFQARFELLSKFRFRRHIAVRID